MRAPISNPGLQSQDWRQNSQPLGMHFDIVVAVWGDLYRQLFLKVCLPSLNTPGNLAALADAGSATLWLYTTSADARELESAALREHLPTAIELRTVVVDGIGKSNRIADHYRDLTRCHQLAVRDAADRDAVMVFLPGDGVWSEGSFESMIARLNEGKRAVLTSGIRVDAETYLAAFAEQFLDADNMTAPCVAENLIASIGNHLHDLTKSSFIDSENFTTWPSIVIWPLGGADFILRAFHLHPMAVWPKVYRDFEGTIDGALLDQTLDSLNEVHIVQDSNEILQVNLDLPTHRKDLVGTAPHSLDAIAAWAGKFSLPYQRTIFRRYPILMTSGSVSNEVREARLADSQSTADRIIELIDRLN